MSTYLEIDGDPNQVGASGAAVRAVSESFTARSRAIAANIRAIEAERPWGDDKYGQAFETTYSFVPDGGRSPLREEILDGLEHGAERLARTGGKVLEAMTLFLGEDRHGAAEIARTIEV